MIILSLLARRIMVNYFRLVIFYKMQINLKKDQILVHSCDNVYSGPNWWYIYGDFSFL